MWITLDCCSEETCLVIWVVIATRHKTTANTDVDILVLLLLLHSHTVRAEICWCERLSN